MDEVRLRTLHRIVCRRDLQASQVSVPRDRPLPLGVCHPDPYPDGVGVSTEPVFQGLHQEMPEPSEKVKMKLRLSAAKELAFMQGNMVLHGVLKPDSVLVFSFVWVIASTIS